MPEPTEGAASGFDVASGPPPVRLADRLDSAEIELGPGNLPADLVNLGEFPLDRGWHRGLSEETRAWRVTSPVDLHTRRSLTHPVGLKVMQGEKELQYRCPARGTSMTWCYFEGDIEVGGDSDPATRKPGLRVIADRVAALIRRMEPQSAGLSPADYARFDLTQAQGDAEITRPGILLPAPSAVSWELEIPANARLDLAVTMVELGVVDGPSSDGARLKVEIDGEAVLSERVAGDQGFQDLQVDLGSRAGQKVRLTLRSEVTGSADWDWVFVGAPIVSVAASGGPRRVVVVGMDTTRYTNWTQNGHSRDTTSAMDPFAASAVLFDNAWAPAPRTRPSFRTATTGKLPLPAMDGPTIGELLGEAGFVTGGVTANVHLVPRFGFNEGFDYWIYQNGATADQEVARAKRWLASQSDRDALLFVHLMDPHVFYDAPLMYKNMFVTSNPGPLEWWMNRWQVVSLARQLNDENRAWLQERYDGEMAYMARYVSDFLAWVCQLPGQTLVVVHSDHGEEFFEHGGYEHNHTLYSELVHALMWWRAPGGQAGGPLRVSEPVALQDIAPTIYDFVGVDPAAWSGLDGVSLRPLLDPGQADRAEALREQLARRALPIGHLMYDTERWAVVADGHKYILRTASNNEELYDLVKDPGEQHDLVEESSRATLDAHLARLGEATGWPTGPGWRVQIIAAKDPFTLVFAQPVDAMVLDPESANPHRANVEWGEVQTTTPEEVGSVSLSEDRRTVTFVPGSYGRGIVSIRTGDWSAGATLVVDEERQEIPAEGGPASAGSVRLRVNPGPVILPQDSTLHHLKVSGVGSADAMEALRALGYVE